MPVTKPSIAWPCMISYPPFPRILTDHFHEKFVALVMSPNTAVWGFSHLLELLVAVIHDTRGHSLVLQLLKRYELLILMLCCKINFRVHLAPFPRASTFRLCDDLPGPP
jgi:hypothetical protein